MQKVMLVAPYDHSREYSQRETYNLNYMLICQHNFPAEVNETDVCTGVYSDRIYTEWEEALEILRKKIGNKYIRFESLFEKDLYLFANTIFKNVLTKLNIDTVTGFRFIRCTNVSSGYPIIYLEIYVWNPKNPKPELYSGSHHAPNILPLKDVVNYFGEKVYPNADKNNPDGRYIDIFGFNHDSSI